MKNLTRSIFSLTIASAMIACGGADKKVEDTTSEEANTTEEVVEAKEYSLNTAESQVMWEGTMLGLYSHNGTVGITEGNLVMEGDNVTGGSFVVDLKSMQPTDENYTEEEGHTAADLVGHLSSGDFFMVDSFPTASFEIIAHDAATNTITGNLTVRGNTNEETVEEVVINLEEGTATGKLVFDRTKYEVSFSHPAEEMVLSDDITLMVNLKM